MISRCSIVMLVLGLVACGSGTDKTGNNASPNNVRPGNNDNGAPGSDAGGDDDTGSTNDDTGNNATTSPDGGETNAATNNNPSNNTNNIDHDGACDDEILVSETIDIDPEGDDGQFYARAVWDGEGVWVVYNRPTGDTDETEEIFAARVSCDRTIKVGPIALTEENGSRNYMVEVASNGGVTHVVWIEQPAGGNAETVRLAVLTQSGQLLFDEPKDITPVTGGEPVSGLVWEPDVAVFEDGSGVIATSGGGFGQFQVALQKYDSSGNLTGDAIFPYPEDGVDQKRPTVAAAEDGTIYVAWTRYKPADPDGGTPEEPERAVFTSIPAGANMAFPATPVPAKPLTNPNQISRFAREPGPQGQYFLAFDVTTSNRADILVRDGSDFETADSSTFGSDGYINFRPSVAGGERGGAVAWYRYNESPLRNEVVVQSFAGIGPNATPDEIVISTDSPGIPPYGPDVTWVGGSAYFVVWGEGGSAPEARVKGRFLALDGL